MITRIVKLHIHPSKGEEFIKIFYDSKATIEGMKGCHNVKLVHDIHNTNLFCTISTWEDENALNQYRDTHFFKQIWPKTKALLTEKPEAWSLSEVANPKENNIT